MRSSKRRASSEAQSSTTHRTTRTVTSVSRKLLDEKENLLKRSNYDNRKALDDRQNLSGVLREEDYFDSGSYRADCIGKPWRSPNLSRRGIHSSYEGSVKSYSGAGEVISSTAWQSTSYSGGEQSSCRLDEGCQETNTEVNRLQTNSETSNNSNSNFDMRTRAMRISEQKALEDNFARHNPEFYLENSVSVNSNNNASQKRGARQITMWKTSGVPSDISASKIQRLQRSATKQISSIFGLDKEDDESECNVRVTRSRTRKVDTSQEAKSDSMRTTELSPPSTRGVSSFTRIYNWIHTSVCRTKSDRTDDSAACSDSLPRCRSSGRGFFKSSFLVLTYIFVTIIHKLFYTPERVRAMTGAPAWPLVPCYAAVALVRWLSSSTLRVCSFGLRSCSLVGKRLFSQGESRQSKSTTVISEATRSKRSFLCCPCPWVYCLLLLPLLLLTASVVKEKAVVPRDPGIVKNNGTIISWIGNFFTAFLASIRDGFLLLISKSDDSIPLNPPLIPKSEGIDKSLYDKLANLIRDHSARLVSQEKELKAQKAILESLVGSHKTSEKMTSNLAVQINKWEGDLKSVRSHLSSLDAALAELRKLKLSTKDTKVSSGDSGVNSKEFALLSQQVKTVAAEQQKQKGFGEELKKLQVLIVKLESHVKEQKQSTTLELNKHEGEFKKLAASITAVSSKDAKASASSAQVSDFSAALKKLSDKVMADHVRLVAFESQQQKLQALFADLEKRLGSQAAATRTKDSSASAPPPQTDKSLTNIAAKLQSLETDQKTLNQRLDQQMKQQQTGTNAAVVDVGGGCKGGGKKCASIAVVQELIDRALAIFAADRIARPDFALESAGGSIIGTRCTQTYTDRPAVFSLFGIPLFRMSRSPRTVIQPALYPGECWAFSGNKGQLVVRLASDIKISGITVEHVPKSLSPNGRIDSAPRQFAVKGLVSESDYKGVLLGEFEFLDNGQPLQTFDLPPPHKVFRYIELQILTNHGHAEYTCVYRIRVHGKILDSSESDTKVR